MSVNNKQPSGSPLASPSCSFIRSWIEAPRWAGAKRLIETLAWELGLDCETHVDKGLIREMVRFKVSGEVDKLRKFQAAYEASLREYERKTS